MSWTSWKKLGGSLGATDWRVYQQLEIFGVLDRVISPGVLENEDTPRILRTAEELSVRFRRGFFLIGCGAWQELWSTNTAPIGFGDTTMTATMPTHAQLAATLRLELLNRFSSRPLFIPPLSADDYTAVYAEMVERLPVEIRRVMVTPSEEDIADAVAAQKGFRYFEEILARAIRARRLACGRETTSAAVAPSTELHQVAPA